MIITFVQPEPQKSIQQYFLLISKCKIQLVVLYSITTDFPFPYFPFQTRLIKSLSLNSQIIISTFYLPSTGISVIRSLAQPYGQSSISCTSVSGTLDFGVFPAMLL
jgi:hypothetical protein